MEWTWAEDRAPVGTDPSADPGVVSEDRAASTALPTSLAYNTKRQIPGSGAEPQPALEQHTTTFKPTQIQPANSAKPRLRFPVDQDTLNG